jgi:protein-tyrosine phosphatase
MAEEEPSLITLENNKKIYLGNAIHGSTLSMLLRLGISKVVNVSGENYNHLLRCEDNEITVLLINVSDHPKSDLSYYFATSNEFIEKALSDSAVVLVHCQEGMSRSPTLVIAFLMFHLRYSLKESICYVRKMRRSVNPNNGFMRQLLKYENELFDAVSVDSKHFEDDYGSGALYYD